jgi:hypothetical protein
MAAAWGDPASSSPSKKNLRLARGLTPESSAARNAMIGARSSLADLDWSLHSGCSFGRAGRPRQFAARLVQHHRLEGPAVGPLARHHRLAVVVGVEDDGAPRARHADLSVEGRRGVVYFQPAQFDSALAVHALDQVRVAAHVVQVARGVGDAQQLGEFVEHGQPVHLREHRRGEDEAEDGGEERARHNCPDFWKNLVSTLNASRAL